MDKKRLERQIDFIREADRAKQIKRRTLLMDASRPENDAEHMWHMALGALIFSEYANDAGIDMLRVIRMALIHDLVEIDAGDTFAYDTVGYEDKEQRERAAAARIYGLLPGGQGDELRALWEEFEYGDTPEAKFARSMDSFMPILHNYATGGLNWRRYGISRERVLKRNGHMAEGSQALWEHIRGLIDDAQDKGYFPEAEREALAAGMEAAQAHS